MDDQFSFEAKELRVTFVVGEEVWALKFGSPGAFERFLQRYNKASFENRFGQEQTDASEAKVRCREEKVSAGRGGGGVLVEERVVVCGVGGRAGSR